MIYDMTSRKKRIKAKFSIINKIISIVCACAKMKQITLPSSKKIRGNLNLIIYGDVGQGKSTILRQIADHLDTEINTGFTKATLLGTVDKTTGIFIPPLVWTSRNNAIIIDELDLGNRHDHNEQEISKNFLSLLEDPKYSRMIGYRSNNQNERDKKDKTLYCKIENSKISVNTRFSFICTTMFDPYNFNSTQKRALITRGIVLYLNFNYDDLDDIADFSNLIKIDDYEIPIDPSISKKNYLLLRAYVRKFELKEFWYLRTINDLARVFIILRRHDYEIYDYICESRKNMTPIKQYHKNKDDEY